MIFLLVFVFSVFFCFCCPFSLLNGTEKLFNSPLLSRLCLTFVDESFVQLSELKEETDKTIGALRIGSRPVTTVHKDAAVIEAFRLMDRYRRSGVALVDSSGRLVGATTGKDLGLFIKNPTLATLEQVTIFKFLNEIRSQQIDIKSPTIAVFEKNTLGRAIQLLATTKVHRVFVCDNEQSFRPIAVISITDVLNYLIGKP